MIRNVDALCVVDFAQTFDQRLFALICRQFPFRDERAMAQRINNVHGQHNIVEPG